MTDFKVNDIVKFIAGGYRYFGKITKVTAKKIYVYDFDEYNDYAVSKENAVLVEPVRLDRHTYRKFARYEITLQDVMEDNFVENIINEDNYIVTPEDVLCALKKFINEIKDIDLFYDQWLCYFSELLSNTESETVDNEFYNDNIVLDRIYGMLVLLDVIDASNTECEKIIKELEKYLEDKEKPLLKRRYPEYAKENLLNLLNEEINLNNVSDELVELYKRFAQELCERKNILGLLAVGYGSYGGNRAFPCDWKKSEECMLELIEAVNRMPDQALYANTLGYIYYYGRTNNGVPQYDKAYKYFSLAAFNRIYEAEYKIADMYKNGYGVPKSLNTAKNILYRLYSENIGYMEDGQFNCKFADIAFRMGNLCKDEEDIYESDFDEMLKYYYQADFAIRMRMKETDYYGDGKVAETIRHSLDEAKELIEFKPCNKVIWYSISSLFYDYLSNGNQLDVKAKSMSGGKVKLTFKPHSRRNEERPKKLFITIPELDMCGTYDSFTVTVKPTGKEVIFLDREFSVDEIGLDEFLFDGVPIMFCEDCMYEIRKPKIDDKKYRFVSVVFNQGGRRYDYLCDDNNIKVGDKVKVIVNDEEKEVTVVRAFEKTLSEMSMPLKYYKQL